MENALEVAKRNIAEHRLKDRVSLHQGDLFGAIGNARYDLVLCNPPYVTSDAVAAFPPEYQAEPVEAHDGGEDGMMLVRRILAEAREHLMPHGVLVMEIGMGRGVSERDYPELDLLWLETAESEGEVFAVTAAASVLHALHSNALDHCIAGHVSAEKGHAKALEKLGMTPLLDLGIRQIHSGHAVSGGSTIVSVWKDADFFSMVA